MSIIKLFILIGVLGGLYKIWGIYQFEDMMAPGPNGFVSVVMPTNSENNFVLILAPANCSSEAAARAYDLAKQLTEKGIPNVLSDRYKINHTETQKKAMDRTIVILEGETPNVFINGLGQSNPSLDDIIAVYERTK